VAVVLLNAVKQQQSLITRQEQQLEQQQQQIDALRKLVCQSNPRARACK
jgi:hypothetical protein